MSVTISWEGGQRFRAETPSGAGMALDGERTNGASPVETLLIALAACMGADIVDILQKGRQEVEGCTITASGTRRETPPRRLTRVRLAVDLEGRALSREKAERAVDLSRTTYCSVWHSMAPDIDLDVEIRLVDDSGRIGAD